MFLHATCFSERKNCLLNSGNHLSTWKDDSNRKLGQTIDVHEQCKIIHGEGYYFSVSFMHVICIDYP